MNSPLDAPFAALAAARCPSYDEMLVAVEREFATVDGRAVAEILDELARPLFGLAQASLNERVVTLAGAAWAALPQGGSDPEAWLLGSALAEGRGTGAVRAALAAELARRAGVRAYPARARGCWVIHSAECGNQAAADVGDAVEPGDDQVGRLCGHQFAFVLLSGLAGAWACAGDAARARRASGLRLLLPLEDTLRERVQRDVRAYREAA